MDEIIKAKIRKSENNEENRFYKNICSPFSYEPTKDKFKIINTNNYGEGVISLTLFSPGDTVFVFTGTIVPVQTLMTLQITPGRYILDDIVMGKVLHSCNPNMDCDINNLVFRARKYIKPGEFLTMDYDTTEDVLFQSFTCECGEEDCRVTIAGRKIKSGSSRLDKIDYIKSNKKEEVINVMD